MPDKASPDEVTWPAGTLMARITEEARQDLLMLARPYEYADGTILIRQGDPSTHVCLLRSIRSITPACVKVTATLENGSESLLGIRVSGDLIGELAAVRGVPRSATVTTCTPALVHRIPRDGFMAFLGRHRDGWQAVSHMIADRLDWANRRRLDIAGYEVPVRLARVIVELVSRHGVQTAGGYELGVRLSQAELGKLIGAKEDAVGQAMRRLKDAGLVRSNYRRVTITKMKELREFSDLAP